MQNVFSPWLFCAAAFLFSFSGHGLKVVIDPGHGGADVGANRSGVKESEITLKVSKMLAERLKSSKDMQAHLTRNEDISMDLKDRVDFAHSIKADLFLSIHVNASPDPRAKGAEFYFQNQLEPNEAAAYLAHQENQLSSGPLAQKNKSLIRAEWPKSLQTIFFDLLDQSRIKRSFLLSKSLRETWLGEKKNKATSLKQAPFQVVSSTEIPATLVEIGFLTNPADFKRLNNETYLRKVVESLVNGLHQYKIESQEL